MTLVTILSIDEQLIILLYHSCGKDGYIFKEI